MDFSFLLRGLIIGFAVAAPVGPIGVLCIRRTLAAGRLSGFVSGLGAATADALYGCIAVFGLTFVSRLLDRHHVWLRLAGGAFLCYLGVRTLLTRPAEREASAKGGGLVAAYATTLALTLANPTTIASFAAAFAILGMASDRPSYVSASLFVLGVFIGSALWWLILSGAVGTLRSRVDDHRLRWVNRISGAILAGFGLLAFASLLR